MAHRHTRTLPLVLSLGFLAEPGAAGAGADAMRRFVAARKADANRVSAGLLVARTFLDGTEASLQFAEVCVDLDVALQVSYVPALFLSPRSEEKERVQRVLDAALSVWESSAEATDEESLYEIALEVARGCHVLLLGSDGRAQAVARNRAIAAFAGQTGRAVLYLDEDTEVSPSHERFAKGDAELSFLNDLADAGGGGEGVDARAKADEWLQKLDRNASRVAPQLRRMVVLPIVCTALASFLSALSHGVAVAGIWAGAGAVLGLAGGQMGKVLGLDKKQLLWVRVRTATEVTRSALALWMTPEEYRVLGPEVLPELQGMIDGLNLLKWQSRKGSPEIGVAAFQQQYQVERIQDQKRYFARQAGKAARQGGRYRRIAKWSGAVAIVFSGWVALVHILPGEHTLLAGGAALPLLTSALFQAATIAGALVVVHDCDRRESRYSELEHSLGRWEKELMAFHSWRPVLRVVDEVERALLAELLEWRSLLKHRKLPRK